MRRDCSRTFNALTGTPLARLRYRERWLDQTQVLIDGLSITKASQCLVVARSTAFRWRHRFLALPHHVKAGHLGGIVEADETCILKSCKGQPFGRAANLFSGGVAAMYAEGKAFKEKYRFQDPADLTLQRLLRVLSEPESGSGKCWRRRCRYCGKRPSAGDDRVQPVSR